jgi:hypothetical protein
MKKISLLLAAIFVLLGPVPASAYIGLCCSKCGGNMPMNIPGGGVPETHEFRFKFSPMFMRMEGLRDGTSNVDETSLLGMPAMGKFMAVQTEMDMYMANLAAGYSFTDDFFGGLMIMWQQKRMPMKFGPMMQTMTGRDGFTMEAEGMADTMLMTKYRLYTDDPLIPTSQFSFFLGLSIPTGSINEKNSNHPSNHPVAIRKDELLPYGMQLGTGTFDPIIGLLYQGSSSPLWWGVNLMYTGRWYENEQDWRPGDEVRLDLYGMYQFRYDMLAQIQLNAKYWGSIRGLLDESRTGESGRQLRRGKGECNRGVTMAALPTPCH